MRSNKVNNVREICVKERTKLGQWKSRKMYIVERERERERERENVEGEYH